MTETPGPTRYYDEYGGEEWSRLETGIDGRLEFEGTVAELRAHLPDDGRVLDAGGGAGRYAIWLADRGYDVTLVDLSAGQLSVASEKLAAHGVADRVETSRQSITDLAFDADTFDATLCLGGPLSHLLAAADRRQAVRELVRVTRPGSPVFASVMGLLGFVQLNLATGHNVAAMPDLLDHGNYDEALLEPYDYENEFTATHFFRRSELIDLLEENHVDVDAVTALEGLGSLYHDEAVRERIADLDAEERDAIVATVDALKTDPVVADLSVHMLAVGYV